MTWYEQPEIRDVLTEREQAIQAELDKCEVPEHVTACRASRNYHSIENETTQVVVCNCGYVRWFVTHELARAVAIFHARTGEEL